MTAPTYVGAGTAAQSTSTSNLATGTPTLPAGWAQNDIFVLWVSTRSASLTLPSGWAAVPNTVPTYPTFGTASHFYWKRAGSSESNPTVTSSASDMYNLQVYAFRGCASAGTPFENLAYTAVESSTTSIVFPAVTTSGSDELILLHVAGGVAGSSVGTVTNASLTGITERVDVNSTNTFDHWAVITGAMTSAGSTGTSTCSWASATTFLAVTMALKSNSIATVNGTDGTSNIVDTAAVQANVPAADTGNGVDTATVTAPVAAADTAGGVDLGAVKVSGAVDVGAWDETTTILAGGATLKFASDTAGSVEGVAPLVIKDGDTFVSVDLLQTATVGINGPLPPGPRIVRIGQSTTTTG